MRTTIELSDKDLEQINDIQKWHEDNHGIKLNRTQIIKKAIYNENYFLHNEYHPEEMAEALYKLGFNNETKQQV